MKFLNIIVQNTLYKIINKQSMRFDADMHAMLDIFKVVFLFVREIIRNVSLGHGLFYLLNKEKMVKVGTVVFLLEGMHAQLNIMLRGHVYLPSYSCTYMYVHDN